MRKIFLLSAVILALAAVKVSAASLTDHPTVAVLPYEDEAAVSQYFNQHKLGEMSRISRYVGEKLVDSGKFRVETLKYLKAIAEIHDFNKSGFVDEETAVRIGKMIGVKYLVAGSITNIATKDSEAGFKGNIAIGGTFNKKTIVATVTIQFINVETGEVELMAHGQGDSARLHSAVTLKPTTTSVEETNSTDSSGIETPVENIVAKTLETTFTMGGNDYTLAQLDNAIFDAVDHMFDDKKRGVLAKLKNLEKG